MTKEGRACPSPVVLGSSWHSEQGGQNHILAVYKRWFWQGNHHIHSHARRVHLVLANSISKAQRNPCCKLTWAAASTSQKPPPAANQPGLQQAHHENQPLLQTNLGCTSRKHLLLQTNLGCSKHITKVIQPNVGRVHHYKRKAAVVQRAPQGLDQALLVSSYTRCVCMCVCLCVHMCACVSKCVYAYLCACVCACVTVCTYGMCL